MRLATCLETRQSEGNRHHHRRSTLAKVWRDNEDSTPVQLQCQQSPFCRLSGRRVLQVLQLDISLRAATRLGWYQT